ncbi:HipA domain-containing protein [Idiomarina sp. ATCH4]|nr:HipA domain-containing protein [Idiomarina sp. ATCH4]MCK7459449.1 HipA domain-containing protein [Idiomarina sp. ATCH4]
MLKFDGVQERDPAQQTFGDPLGYGAIKHVNYHDIGSFSYEELFQVARQLRLPREDAIDLFRRMVFNHVATNHDDHSKNFGVMLEGTQWRLSPAYDVAFSYKPGNPWVEQHWMSLNGKRSDHSRADFYALSDVHLSKVPRQEIDAIIDDVINAVAQWPQLAKENEVPETLADSISSHLKLK